MSVEIMFGFLPLVALITYMPYCLFRSYIEIKNNLDPSFEGFLGGMVALFGGMALLVYSLENVGKSLKFLIDF